MRRFGWVLLVLTAAALRAEGLSRKERDDLAGRGAELFSASQPAAARELWEKMLAGGATGAEQRRWRPWVGRAFEAEGNFQKALTAYQEAYDRDPKNVDRLVDLARVYDTVELKERALELYDRALKSDRSRTDVVLALGFLHFNAGRLAEARRYADDALRRDSRDPGARRLLAQIEESQGDLEGAARRREGLLAEHPAGADAVAVGRLWARAGELELAQAAFRRAADLGVATSELLFERGAVAWRRGDVSGAEDWLGQTLAKDPGCVPAVLLLSVVDWERGRGSRAQARLRGMMLAEDSPWISLRDRLITALTYGSAPGEKK